MNNQIVYILFLAPHIKIEAMTYFAMPYRIYRNNTRAFMHNFALPAFCRTLSGVLCSMVLAACSTPTTENSPAIVTPATKNTASACTYDRARLLGLDVATFDQDPNGGWRAVAQQPGCFGAAADLIRDYHANLAQKSYLLYWHEGQVRAMNGDTATATQLFEMSHSPDDTIGWNIYVDATIAFMKQDKTALGKAYLALANLPVPANAQLDRNGNALAASWPPNMRVVEDLLACFGQEYRVAYQNCRR